MAGDHAAAGAVRGMGPVLAALILAMGCGGAAVSDTASAEPAPSLVCVVRHAEAWKNVEPRPPDATADELDRLTPEGERQVRALRSTLPADLALVWSSPTRRTRQTAEQLAPEHPVAMEPALRNLDGGLGWAERRRAAARGEDLRPPEGESLADGAARARQVLARLREELHPGASAVLVTHGDFAPLLLGELRGRPLLERPQWDTLGHGAMACEPLPVVR